MDSKILFAVIVLLALVIGGYYLVDNNTDTGSIKEASQTAGFGIGHKAIVYKSPTCGCCVGYADELKKQGFDVSVVETNNMNSVKNKYGIPTAKQSCHTIAMGDYFVEGHVPMEAVEKLLKEQPEVDGIGLPRMPSGTPGMPGPKRAPYEVYQVKNGEFSDFVTL
tara:strand:+ start:5283 stop:5777 length:495 start_codon:yes stop_codon:yes gene_type:complete